MYMDVCNPRLYKYANQFTCTWMSANHDNINTNHYKCTWKPANHDKINMQTIKHV